MIYVIKGTSNNQDFYAIKSTSSGKTVYYLSSDLEGATTWKTESGARNVLNKGVATSGFKFEEIKVVSLTEDEYQSITQQESQAQLFKEFEQMREQIFGDKVGSPWSDNDRQIATILLNLQVGDKIRIYPRNSLNYSIAEITEIKSITFVVESNEYSRLTGEGDKANYALPDDEVADHVMSDRVIKDFCLRPSAYNLTTEQKLAIAKILRG